MVGRERERERFTFLDFFSPRTTHTPGQREPDSAPRGCFNVRNIWSDRSNDFYPCENPPIENCKLKTSETEIGAI